MHSLQREARSSVVIEQRWLPLGAVMTLGAGRSAIRLYELGPMNIGVAPLASCRRHLEINVDKFGLKIGRLVAIDASHGAMRSEQGERSLGMIEAG